MALRDDLRPNTLDEVVGQHTAKRVIEKVLENFQRQRILEHLLLIGDSGLGKTTVAQIIARTATGQDEAGARFGESTWLHFNSAQCGDVDFIRDELMEYSRLAMFKVFVFDEAHRITPVSQDLLLSVLERTRTQT